MQRFSQSPTDPDFVQDPYPFYERARAAGDLVWWAEYDMPMATSYYAVNEFLRDRRFGREIPSDLAKPVPARLKPFYDIEAHSMLELEPPRHTRLRKLVTRAFASARIVALMPRVDAIVADLIANFPAGEFDLLDEFCRPLPVRVIAQMMGVPEARAGDLLGWSNSMVRMYQAGRTREDEDAAVAASIAFRAFLEEVIAARRSVPGDDLLSALIAAEQAGESLSHEELIATTILLLNAGHEATVHTLGNGIRAIIDANQSGAATDRDTTATLIEEVLRFDPPLHLFTRYAYEDMEVFDHQFRRGDQVGLLLASANRDSWSFTQPDRFDPARRAKAHASFGAGIHFCVGAPLARMELSRAIPALFAACPDMKITQTSRYADIYHFHGLERLMVRV